MVLSSAIVCDHDRRIAEVCFHMIAELSAICDLRSAIVCDHMETSLNTLREVSYFGAKEKSVGANGCTRAKVFVFITQ